MLYQILAFLIEIAVTLIGGACLLRLYMRWRRMSMGNPVGRFVQALSDWLVLPLQRLVPSSGSLDVASLLATWLLKLLQYGLLVGMLGLGRWSVLPLLALLGVAKLAVSVATAVIIVAAVLSWTGNRTPVRDVFERLCEPMLAPLRRHLPLVGGIDLSPLLLVVALQVAGIVLGSMQAGLLGAGAAMLAG
ncbi:YggT family protein [Ottowia sp.]|uniref:YggT family protein n=1 Tax=Ottowia sp. TaxID=1898956 RepID=UPI002C017A3A|nr:YggT family protein [Ottowia sp.]HOB66362.1 YggT family protein [Ottowia sp.]HPZ58823.1 YggT family protein [Ottowia sp.]